MGQGMWLIQVIRLFYNPGDVIVEAKYET